MKRSITSRRLQANLPIIMHLNTIISPDMLSDLLQQCKKGKMCGYDNVFYEHMIYGGKTLRLVLARLYSAMLKFSHVPSDMNRGVIVTLHKGGRKSKHDPQNYRAITLTSTILKVYESVLLTRANKDILRNLSPQQGGFQQQLGCIMTSFSVRESILFAKEHHSKSFICYLDCRQAFDRVWHDGLIFKLKECGLDHLTFKSLVSLYSNMTSCVRNESFISDWFSVKQGTRQGGKSSPILYLLYINGLIQELEHSKLGFCIYNYNIGSPTVADDMILFSMSKYSLDQMLQICYNYSLKWRFEYNANKCSVVVYNESKYEFDQSNRLWKLGNQIIHEDIQYTHLGIICNKYCSLNDNVHSASIKLRGTLLNISNSGISSGALNPISLLKIYRSVVLPKSLYGCELWSYLTSANILEIERAHRFCIKYIQRLPIYTSNMASLSSLGLVTIETEINYKKLQFLGQLCRLPCQYLSKRIFINRLIRYKGFIERQSLGFIPDIIRLLQKYNLMDYINIFIDTAFFPSKYAWKSIIKRHVYGSESDQCIRSVYWC